MMPLGDRAAGHTLLFYFTSLSGCIGSRVMAVIRGNGESNSIFKKTFVSEALLLEQRGGACGDVFSRRSTDKWVATVY